MVSYNSLDDLTKQKLKIIFKGSIN